MKRSLFLSFVFLTAAGSFAQAQTPRRATPAGFPNNSQAVRYTPTRAASYQDDDFVLDSSGVDLSDAEDPAEETSRRVSQQLQNYQAQAQQQMQPPTPPMQNQMQREMPPSQSYPQTMVSLQGAYPKSQSEYCSDCGQPNGSCGCGGHDLGGQHGGTNRNQASPGYRMNGAQNDQFIQDGRDAGDAGCDTSGLYDDFGNEEQHNGRDKSGRIRIGGVRGQSMNTVVGGGWLSLRRDGADFRTLSYEQAMPDNRMLVGDADIASQNGLEVFIARQSDQGTGWEARYWGLEQSDGTSMLGYMPQTSLLGLNTVTIAPWGTIGGLYNMADRHDLIRTSELHNIEFNLLNYASSCGPRNFIFRRIAGLRVIRFSDDMNYSAFSSTNFGAGFSDVNYNINTTNTFVGAQLGGQGEYCFTDRIRLGLGSKVGVGGNSMDVNQRIQTSSSAYGIQASGADFNCMHSDTDLAMFGEMEAKAYYHLTDSFRISVGYRLFGLAGVATAEDQIPYDYTDVTDIHSIKRDGSVIFQGLTLGAEYCF